MDVKEFWSFKLLKLKYRKEDQVVQLLNIIGPPQEIGLAAFNLRKI